MHSIGSWPDLALHRLRLSQALVTSLAVCMYLLAIAPVYRPARCLFRACSVPQTQAHCVQAQGVARRLTPVLAGVREEVVDNHYALVRVC